MTGEHEPVLRSFRSQERLVGSKENLSLRQPAILVIGGGEGACQNIPNVLQEGGDYDVATILSGQEALEMIKDKETRIRPDVVLINHTLKKDEMTSLALVRELVEVLPMTKCILFGESVPKTVFQKAISSDVFDCLEGSDGVARLRQCVERAIEKKREEIELRRMAFNDILTGLYNRQGFFHLAERELVTAKRSKQKMILLFADFDGLKLINDTFGHPKGDKALIAAADILREVYRESDIIARIGGDEFVVFFAYQTEGSEVAEDMGIGFGEEKATPAEILIARFQERLEKYNGEEKKEANRQYDVWLSVGTAVYDPEDPCSIDELLARADRAIATAKQIYLF